MYTTQIELLSYKKKVTKNETIYIVSSYSYSNQGIYKVGRTKNAPKTRNSTHNTSHVKGDKMKVLRAFKVNDSVSMEKFIHAKLEGLKLQGEKEWFICPYDLLENIVDLIVHNDDEQNIVVNKIIDTVYKLKEQVFNSVDWTSGIPEGIFEEYLVITDSSKPEEPIGKLDVTEWSEAGKRIFVRNCYVDYCRINKIIKEKERIYWKSFQEHLFSGLSIPRNKFKSGDWKPYVREEIKSIKWRK